MTEAVRLLLLKELETLVKKPCSEVFIDSPVAALDRDSALHYVSLVPFPLYLDLIIERCRNGTYRQLQQVDFELKLISRNCMR
jgi:hypothetical protein